MHFQSKDYTEIANNMHIILYHFPLINEIPCRQYIYIYIFFFLTTDHTPKINGEHENYTVKQVLIALHTKFSYTDVPYGRLLLKKLPFTEPRGSLLCSCNLS